MIENCAEHTHKTIEKFVLNKRENLKKRGKNILINF